MLLMGMVLLAFSVDVFCVCAMVAVVVVVVVVIVVMTGVCLAIEVVPSDLFALFLFLSCMLSFVSPL